MKFYNYKKIDDLVQPLIKMMQVEYPNNAQLVIDSNSAKIQYVHQDLILLESSLMPQKEAPNALASALATSLGVKYNPNSATDNSDGGNGDG